MRNRSTALLLGLSTMLASLLIASGSTASATEFHDSCQGVKSCIARKLEMIAKDPLAPCPAECRERCRRGIDRYGNPIHFDSVKACVEFSAEYGRGRVLSNAMIYGVPIPVGVKR
jgi:hypothetical protein